MRAENELTAAQQAVEADLRRLYAVGDPDPAFVARLEQRLAAQAQSGVTAPTRETPRRRFLPEIAWGWRLLAVDLALLILLAVGITALGPQRVLAQFERMLRYVPGIGFVDLSDTRVLPAPVEVTIDAVTVRIEQAVAEADRTRLVIRAFGLPDGDTIFMPGADMGSRVSDFAGRLRLSDGSTLDFTGLFLQYGEAASALEFAALPPDAMRFTLELDRLPLVPSGRAPEGWRIPLTLVRADAPDAAPVFPEPYKPAGASDTRHGVTLSIQSVAHTADETAITLRGAWTDPALQIYGLGGALSTPVLFDNVGHVYGFKSSGGGGSSAVAVVEKVVVIEEGAPPTPTPVVRTLEKQISVEPLSAFAREVTLQIDGVQTEVALSNTFRIDIPAGAQVGDRWPLDVTLDVAGFPVRLTAAALDTETMTMREGQAVERTLLTFTVAPTPDRDSRRLGFFQLEAPNGGWGSGPGSSSDGAMTLSLELNDGATIRPGPLDVTIRGASITLLGPWRLTWPIPGRERQVSVPATLRPQATDTHDGLTLAIKEVVHTDRLTRVLLDLQDPPAGVKLAQAQVMWFDERLRGDHLDFADDLGRQYAWDRGNISWLRPGEAYSFFYLPTLGAQSVRLPPVDPRARRLTLTLPAIEVVRPGAGGFTVTVPPDITLKDDPRAYGVLQSSDPWPVDIKIEMGGQTAYYTQAMLTAQRGQLWVSLGNPDWAAGDESGISGLCNLTYTGPDGAPVTSAQNSFMFGPGPCAFAPGFSPQDAAGRLVAGEYRVAFDGVPVRVVGPWRLAWDVGAE